MEEPYALNDEHYENLMTMAPDERSTYFVTRVADAELVYALVRGEHWVTQINPDREREVFFVWPHPRLAEAYAKAEFPAARVDEVTLEDWLAFSERLTEDCTLVGIMGRPDETKSYLMVEPADLARDLVEYRRQTAGG